MRHKPVSDPCSLFEFLAFFGTKRRVVLEAGLM